MKPETRRCKCLNCSRLFIPDHRNRERQKYCSAPECKRASKRARQQAWLSKPENRDYFRDAQNVKRVQDWRKAHPVIGSAASARTGVRYKTPARRNRLRPKSLPQRRYQTPAAVR